MTTECDYKCESGFLVDDGVEDAILVTREMAIDAGDRELEGQVYQRLLIPTTFVPCFQCNSESWLNRDLEGILCST